MCFSATASFAAALVLIPSGLASIQIVRRRSMDEALPLASVPLLFGLQQSLEGMVWLNVERSLPELGDGFFTVGFPAFALVLWPIWIPWTVLRLTAPQRHSWRQHGLRSCLWLGMGLAALLWLPIWQAHDQVTAVVRQGSILYTFPFPLADHWGFQPVTLMYSLIIIFPLLISGWNELRALAYTLIVTFVVSSFAYLHAFSSVWCFFSACLSVQIFLMLRNFSIPHPLQAAGHHHP